MNSSSNPFEASTSADAPSVPWTRLVRLGLPWLLFTGAAAVYATLENAATGQLMDPTSWIAFPLAIGGLGLLLAIGTWRLPSNRVFWLGTAPLMSPLSFAPLDMALNVSWNAIVGSTLGYLAVLAVVPSVRFSVRGFLGFIAVGLNYQLLSLLFGLAVLPFPFFWVATGLLFPMAALHPDQAVVPASLRALVQHPGPLALSLTLGLVTFGINSSIPFVVTGSFLPETVPWIVSFATELQWLTMGWGTIAATTLWIAHREET